MNDPDSEENLTPERTEKFGSLAGRLLYHFFGRSACAIRNWFGDASHEYTQISRRGTIAPSSEVKCWNTWCGSALV